LAGGKRVKVVVKEFEAKIKYRKKGAMGIKLHSRGQTTASSASSSSASSLKMLEACVAN